MPLISEKNDSIGSRRQLLALIRDFGPISRATLAVRADMTRPTVSAIVAEFMEAGLIREIGKGESTGGKRPILLQLDDSRHFTIGIDLGENFVIRGVRCDLTGRIRQSAVLEYQNRFESIRDVIADLIRQLAGHHTYNRIRGVGIAVSGTVNTETGEIRDSETLDIVGKDLKNALEELTGFPICFENRASSAALAETMYGAGKHFRNLIYLTSGCGIGAGIVVDGKVFRGSHGAAGELGCQSYHGTKRTLQEELQVGALTEEAARRLRRPLTYHEFLQLLRADDPTAKKLVVEAAGKLADAVRIAVALIDPEAVVLGGQLLELGTPFFDHFRSILETEDQKIRFGRKLAVNPSALGEFGVAQGGATVILEQIFQLY